MSDKNKCHLISRRLFVHIVDGIWLMLILIVQGAILNYYIIMHYKHSVTPYFLFVADLLCVATYIGALAASYHYLNKVNHEDSQDGFNIKPRICLNANSKLGVMPLSYASWLFYIIILVTKISVIFESGLIESLSAKDHFGPQLLKVTIAASSFVFLLLVEGLNWTKRGTPRYSYVTSVCGKTGIEIFDSVALLSILMEGPKGLSESIKDVILILAAINFFLPTVKLYQLSFPDFSINRMSLPITIIYLFLHMACIDIPFLTIRLYLWLGYRENGSMFLMKNILSICLTIRCMYPELVEFKNTYIENK
ncbi:hypothetical protein O3M35_012783 [Rhynocoris fuscipes]|uniref:Uncharacterized protein n=1 Tax=Rhynocoris fuscipes TaxID=488301 RepID=A0AAW1CJP3_9HEMI